VHIELGYPEEKMVVIPNGYDLDQFSPDEVRRKEFRAHWNIREDSILIGAAGRFHPQKDYRTFLNAASVLSRMFPRVVYILCGRGMDRTNDQLVRWIEEFGVGEQVRLLGEQQNMAAFYNGLDIFTLSASHGEAFPNVVSEAMSCGVPCVVTDVGDAALIVGKTGVVVSPGDPDALAAGWMKLMNLSEAEKAELSSSARGRVVAHFSLETMVEAYENLYRV
jgi:glycosyltransferase involved in cell wall biosynthesis